MKILLLDNYDSFTYNLVQMIEQIIGNRIDVFQNDKISIDEIEKYDKIVLSPGPGIPKEAGILLDTIKTYASSKSILGICLGQQAIAEAFGGSLFNLSNIYHGVATTAKQINNHLIFNNLPKIIKVGRYHSWAVNIETLPEDLMVTSIDDQDIIMSLRHKKYDIHAVQYHPESILTPYGKKILENFLLK